MKLGRKLFLLLIVVLLMLFLADFMLKMTQYHGDTKRALKAIFDPIRKPLIAVLRKLLEFLED